MQTGEKPFWQGTQLPGKPGTSSTALFRYNHLMKENGMEKSRDHA